MKRSVKWLYHLLMQRVFMELLKNSVAKLKKEKIYVVDIDNTLADTWPSLKDGIWKSDRKRYRTLSIFIGMRRYVLDKQRSHKVIFISARSYLSYNATRAWLEDCGIVGCTLILVPDAMDKIHYLLALLQRKHSLVYIDDLSYNHENGVVKRYDLMLPILNQLPITYLGLKEIEQINATHEAHHQDLKTTIQTLPDYHLN